MDNNKDRKNQSEATGEERLHQPHKSNPGDHKSGDKLRENPSNDEETISQNRQGGKSRPNQSELSRTDEEDTNQVTNEEDQNRIVNPTDKDWEKDTRTDPSIQQKNNYEEISDDPDGTQKKIPKM